jgi:hypothetical protein
MSSLNFVSSASDIVEVCSSHGLWPSMRTAVDAVHRAFHPVVDVRAEVDVDPDTDERRVVLDVTVDAPVDELLRQYEKYTRSWVAAASAEKRDWIRLSFHSLRD